jgi:hypothetical protein
MVVKDSGQAMDCTSVQGKHDREAAHMEGNHWKETSSCRRKVDLVVRLI